MDTTTTSYGPAVCRICMCGETSIPYHGKQAGEPLISPCCCSGTMGLYHRSCLEHWLTITKTKNCEICKFVFKISQKSRSFWDYIKMKGYKTRNNLNSRNPFVDLGFILLVTPLAATALYLCLRGAAIAGRRYHIAYQNRLTEEKNKNLDTRNESSMEFALFVFVASVIFFAYFMFLIVMLINHRCQFKKWQSKNILLYVVDQLDAEQSLHYNPRWKPNSSLKSKFLKYFTFFKANEQSIPITEVTRSEMIPINPIIGIPPSMIHNFNQTSRDSDNTHLHDNSQNPLPFNVRSPNQMLSSFSILSNSPQMYSEDKEYSKNHAFPPTNLDNLFCTTALSPSVRIPSTSSSHKNLHKVQSVYSVCSFGNGVISCSTPVADKKIRVNYSTEYPFSTFKNPNPIAPVLLEDETVNDSMEMRGRFHIEKLENPKF